MKIVINTAHEKRHIEGVDSVDVYLSDEVIVKVIDSKGFITIKIKDDDWEVDSET